MVYGVLLSESPFFTRSEQAQFRTVSLDWHRFLGFQSAWQDGMVASKVRRVMEAERDAEEARRWKMVRQTHLGQALQRLMGHGTGFRGIQEAGLDAIVRRHPRVVVVMRTGGGKSLLFMLPAAMARTGVTIVVVPLNSLREDLIERCTQAGIHCTGWDSNRPPYWAQIILVTPESAVTKAFGRFVNEKRAMRQLDRIVIDECHVVLDATSTWRPQMLQLSEMGAKGVQVVYLTATLPPRDEAAWFRAMELEADRTTVLRDCTTRANVRYQVHEHVQDQQEEAVVALVRAKQQQYPLPQQIIVYCRRVAQARRLGQVLACPAYYRTVGDERQKREIWQQWRQRRSQVMTATNAFGLGIDAAQIRVVIHVGLPSTMRDYAQESGRAGRDGVASEAIIMRGVHEGRHGQRVLERGWQADVGMEAFIAGKECRRVVMDREMDGRMDRGGCAAEEVACDVCHAPAHGRKRRIEVAAPDDSHFSEQDGAAMAVATGQHDGEHDDTHPTTEAIEAVGVAGLEAQAVQEEVVHRQRIEARIRQEITADAVQQRFDGWVGRCTICRAHGQAGIGHAWQTCERFPQDYGAMKQTMAAIQGVEWERFAGCSFCRAPQAICSLWEPVSTGGPLRFRRRRGGTCSYPGVLEESVGGLMTVEVNTVVEAWVLQEQDAVGVDRSIGGTWEGLRKWLGQKTVHGRIEMSEMCRLFYIWG